MQPADTVLTVPRTQPVIHPYAQIAAHYRTLLTAHQLAPGDPFPSIGDIAKEWGVSKPTAQRAVALLRQEGRVRTEPGRGAFVTEPGPPPAEGAGPC